jgi:hypothetical protein
MKKLALESYWVLMVVEGQYYSNQRFKIRSDGYVKGNYL